jgi:nucleoside-diphosphate-sugar epimerase
MGLHVIVGAGPIGTATAQRLLESGNRVRMVTRRGIGAAGAELVATDASNAVRMRELTEGADVLYNCANPPYHRWPQEWPPIASSLIAAAESSGAVLASVNNLYCYGRVTGPMSEQTPLRPVGVKAGVRAATWQQALEAHRAGRIRTVEVRGSDYLGRGAATIWTLLVLPRLLAGKTAFVPAHLDAPHTWTNPLDVARLLVTVASDPRAWGRAWHAPSVEPRSIRQLSRDATRVANVRPSRIARMPYPVLWAGGVFDPTVRELRETQYQFSAPFVLDSSDGQNTFGLRPTPYEDSLRQTIDGLRAA